MDFPTTPPNQNDVPQIPPGKSLQGNQGDKKTQSDNFFPDVVFDSLPDLLKSSCEILADQTEKEVFLISALGVISGILPNVQGFYDGSFVAPNLFCFVVGGYGTGKGGLKYSRLIAQAIHKKRIEESKQAQAHYKQLCIDAKEANEPAPDPPPQKTLFIPANNSHSGFIELLDQNKGMGVVYEPEADTLVGSFKSDHGNFSDSLRKGFHGEADTLYRKTNGVHIYIERPQFAVVLSGTPDQLQRLMPSAENGLFSRFLFYRLPANNEFKDVFSDTRRGYPAHFEQIGSTFLEIYTYLEALTDPLEIQLTAEQQRRFLGAFQRAKADMLENASADLGGVANRQGLQCFRIAMILTALRNFGHADYSPVMVCEDVDFENALRIVEILRGHALGVYYELPQAPTSREAAAYQVELSQKAVEVARAKVMFEQGKSYAEIAREILGDANKKGTVYKWLNRK